MKRYLSAIFFLFVSSCASNASSALETEGMKSKYRVGQIWSFKSRSNEPSARLTIVKIESDEKLGNIYTFK